MLFGRIIGQGTINEPGGKPDPQYSLPSTVNWMKALALLVSDPVLDFQFAKAFYAGEGKRAMENLVENTILEQLFLSLHHLSALEQMQHADTPADTARMGILAWYYGISNAASAMIANIRSAFTSILSFNPFQDYPPCLHKLGGVVGAPHKGGRRH